jgi:hypothetical protein
MKLDKILVPGLSWRKGKKSGIDKYLSDLRDNMSETIFFAGGRIAIENLPDKKSKLYLYPKTEMFGKCQVKVENLVDLKKFNLN